MDADRFNQFAAPAVRLRARRMLALALVAALGCGLLAGCKSDPGRELLERELRRQENAINHLENHLEDYEQKIASLQRENAALKTKSPTDTPAPLTRPATPKLTPGDAKSSRRATDDPGKLRPPVVDFGPMNESKKPIGGGLQLPNPIDKVPPAPPSDDDGPDADSATQIHLNNRMTGGWNSDGRPGDEGVRVTFQTRNATGKTVRAPGEISVVLLDPSLEGDQARVARWDLSAEDTRRLLRKSSGEDIHLELPWKGKPPANSDLQLFLRYTAPRGMQLVAEQQVEVHPAGAQNASTKRATPSSAESDDTPPPSFGEEELPEPPTSRKSSLLRRKSDEPRLLGPLVRRPAWTPDR